MRTRRRAAVAGTVALVTLVVGAVTAVGGGVDLLAVLDQNDDPGWLPPENDARGWAPPEALAVRPRAEIARGRDWAFAAWTSGDATCLAYAAGPTPNAATACGRPHRPGDDTPKHVITLLATPGGGEHGAADGRGAIVGAVLPDVARVELEFPDGGFSAEATEAPKALQTTARFFIVRMPLEFGDPRAGLVMPAMSFYAADGRRLERVDFRRLG